MFYLNIYLVNNIQILYYDNPERPMTTIYRTTNMNEQEKMPKPKTTPIIAHGQRDGTNTKTNPNSQTPNSLTTKVKDAYVKQNQNSETEQNTFDLNSSNETLLDYDYITTEPEVDTEIEMQPQDENAETQPKTMRTTRT